MAIHYKLVKIMKDGEIVELSIDGLGKHGEGVATLNGLLIFVDGALPKERVRVRLNLIKPVYAKAQLLSIEHANENRINPPCTRYKDCGGCQVMHLSYAGQLQTKSQMVKDALKEIGGFPTAHVLPCLASPKPFHYRNKIQLPVAKKGAEVVAGFYRRGSHEIVPYEECLVHHDSMEKSVLVIRELCQSSSVEPYCEATQTGTLRHFLLRANEKGEQLIGLVTNGRQKSAVRLLAQQIQSSLKNVIGIVENINRKKQNTILGDENNLLIGRSFLQEKIENLTFNISLPSFFQVNLPAAKILYTTALNFADIDQNTTVLDAYCGIGTMSLLASRLARKVIGAECVEQAVLDARENAQVNGIANAEFIIAKIEENVALFKDIDVALVNPPRQGLDAKVVAAINEYGPRRVVYISCNPATLARDARMLEHYTLLKVQPVDMFPQTMHVESVALFERHEHL